MRLPDGRIDGVHIGNKLLEFSPFAFEMDKWYRVAIEIIDHHFTLFIDQQELLSFKDKTTFPGTVSILTGYPFEWWDGEPAGKIRMEIDYIRVAREKVKRLRPQINLIPTTWATIKNARLEER